MKCITIWGIFVIIATIVILLILSEKIAVGEVIEEGDYTSSKKDNSWRWTPAFGDVSHYVVEKSTDGMGEWEVLPNVLPTVVDGKVRCTVVSEVDESYQLRVYAVDNNGQRGINSFVSNVLHVRLRPGKPEFVEEEE